LHEFDGYQDQNEADSNQGANGGEKVIDKSELALVFQGPDPKKGGWLWARNQLIIYFDRGLLYMMRAAVARIGWVIRH
jgi:hypothetical protein